MLKKIRYLQNFCERWYKNGKNPLPILREIFKIDVKFYYLNWDNNVPPILMGGGMCVGLYDPENEDYGNEIYCRVTLNDENGNIIADSWC